MFGRKNNNNAVDDIELFFDAVSHALPVFKAGVRDFLYKNDDEFNKNLQTISELQNEANALRRKIESDLYTQSVLVRFRGDIMRLLESMNHIVNILNNSLFQFEIEQPFIPAELNSAFMKLTDLSTLSVECAIPAAKAYFKNAAGITDKIHRVYFYEKESNTQAQAIKRKVFHEMDSLKLSQKFHLRYFALHIEEISDAAEKVADQLSVMSIKRGI